VRSAVIIVHSLPNSIGQSACRLLTKFQVTHAVLGVLITSFAALCVCRPIIVSCKRNIAEFGYLNLFDFSDFVKMEKLPTEQQEALKKANTERLRILATKTGAVDDDILEKLDRAALLDIVIQDMLARKEEEKGATGGRSLERTDRLRELELQLELKRIEAETERRRMEIEDARAQREHEFRMAHAGRLEELQEERDENGENIIDDSGRAER